MLRCYPRDTSTAPWWEAESSQITGVYLLTEDHHIGNSVTGFWWGSLTLPGKKKKNLHTQKHTPTTKPNQTQKTLNTHTKKTTTQPLCCDSMQPSPPLHKHTGYHKRTRKWKHSGYFCFPEKLLPHMWLSHSVKVGKTFLSPSRSWQHPPPPPQNFKSSVPW